MKTVIDAALSRSRTVLSALFLILVCGTVAYIEIPKEAEPDINIPLIFVNVTHRGISPEDSERLLVRPLEQELKSVEGMKEMSSTAFEGGASVVLEFEAGFDSDQALLDVREQVDIAKPDLPSDSDEPIVSELNFSQFPVIVLTLSGDVPERTLIKMARDLQDKIETIPAVLEADIGGDRDEQAEIILEPSVLESYGLTADRMGTFFARSNRLIAAGTLDSGQGRFSVKVPGLIETVQEIMDFPVIVKEDSVVRLSDVATGRQGFVDPEGFARFNGKQAVTLEVSKRTGENLIETVETVKALVEKERQKWPQTVRLSYSQDQSIDIKQRLDDLQNSVITAVLLVMVIVVAALGGRSGLLVGIAIPGSFLTAILALGAAGITINMVVLFGLILAVGMLVDGAIVITEYADRKMTEGFHKKEAYALAAKRMSWPVIASTATTLAAFLPLAFWTGVIGEFMKYLPITLLATLTASLLMALVFVPTLGGVIGKPGSGDAEAMKAIAASEKGDVMSLHGITGLYAKLLNHALNHAGRVLICAVLFLIGSFMLYGKFGAGIEFFPSIEPEQIVAHVKARGNLSTYEKDALVKEVEEKLLSVEDFSSVYARSGHASRQSSGDTVGMIYAEFKDWRERRPAKEVLKELRASVADLSGFQAEIQEEEHGPGQGKPIVLELSAIDYDHLIESVGVVRKGLSDIDGIVDIEDSRPLPGIEWEIEFNRAQAAKFNVDIAALGDMVQLVTRGLKVSSYRPDTSDDEIDIVARYPEEYRSISQLEKLRVNTQNGSVPASAFVSLSSQPKTDSINRVDGRRVMTLKADVRDGLLPDDKVKEIQAWLESNPLPDGVTVTFKGEDKDKRESQAFLGKAFLVALFLMAIILVTQFNSFYFAFLILSAVILSTIGVLLGLLVTGQPFGIIMGGIGVISLAGIVVNNNIVLIDTYERLAEDFESAREAVLRTGVQRLRPVLLTTVTTIFGLIPMAMALNVDFINRDITVGAPSMQWWVQLSTSVVSGLTFATILTLIVTPCALMLGADVGKKFKRMFEE